MTRKFLSILTLLVCILWTCMALADGSVSVSFQSNAYTLTKGQILRLNPKVENGVGKAAYEYTSDDSSVVTVNNQGQMKAQGLGQTMINCNVTINGEVYPIVCRVRVVEPVKKLTPAFKTIEMKRDDTADPAVVVTPETATNHRLVWQSSDSEIAWVDDEGLIHAGQHGVCTLTATAADGYGAKTTIRVTVPRIVLPVDELIIDSPDGADFTYWVSTDEAISASASNNGFTWEEIATYANAVVVHITPQTMGLSRFTLKAGGKAYSMQINIKRDAVYKQISYSDLRNSTRAIGLRYRMGGEVLSIVSRGSLFNEITFRPDGTKNGAAAFMIDRFSMPEWLQEGAKLMLKGIYNGNAEDRITLMFNYESLEQR